MKFSLNLDESLFDDEFDGMINVTDVPAVDPEFDDDFSEYEDEDHATRDVPKGPATGADTGVANELIALINDEWEAISGYSNAIASLRARVSENKFYADAIKVLEEISAEENAHVGQLQEVLRRISPNAGEIRKGEKEAKSQLGFVNGVLPVQSWDNPPVTRPHANDAVCDDGDEMCSISDVDDEL